MSSRRYVSGRCPKARHTANTEHDDMCERCHPDRRKVWSGASIRTKGRGLRHRTWVDHICCHWMRTPGNAPRRRDVGVMLMSILRTVATWFGDGLRYAPVQSGDEIWIDEVTPGWVMHDLMRVQRTKGGPAVVGAAAAPLHARPRQNPRRDTHDNHGCSSEQTIAGPIPCRSEFRARNR